MMDEATFVNSIDCQFPYDDRERAADLARQGIAISPNAAFMVLHEIVRAPSEVPSDAPGRVAALQVLDTEFEHELVGGLIPAARQLIEGCELTVSESLKLIEAIGGFPHQYNALAIAYFGCDDTRGEVERVYKAIVQSWREAQP